MISLNLTEMIKYWVTWPIYLILPNPSHQDQLGDHFFPKLGVTYLLVTFVPYGAIVGLSVVLLSLYEELIKDGHWRDLFSTSVSGQDGRVDLFFKLLGSTVVYLAHIGRYIC